MPDSPGPRQSGRTRTWEKVDRAVKAFEDAWSAGERPAIEDFLRGASAERPVLLWELVHVDLERRWQAGEAPEVEAYLRRFPELHDDPARELDLIAADYRLRRRKGAVRDASEYVWRFPEHGSRLAARLAAEDEAARIAEEAKPAAESWIAEVPTVVEPKDGPAQSSGAPPDAAPDPTLPSVPGYVVLRKLGKGGMGVVYLARQLGVGREVALKMIRSGEHAGPDELARFRSEAHSLGRLQHPHIVQIFDVGEYGGLPYFSLEYCPGGSLDEELRGTPQPPREAAKLVRTLATAVQAAHEAGVVHRDLKPANVLLDAAGTPKVTDFGLAKKLDEAGRTVSGAVVGTPSYMAPEQAEGKGREVGPLADVYALGAILYECLTGRPPFKAATVLETLTQVLADDPVPPQRLNPQVPRDLNTVCLKCLEKSPDRRYASAAALAEDLRRFLEYEPILAVPAGPWTRVRKAVRRRPVVSALTAGIVLVAAIGFSAVVWSNGQMRSERDRADDRTKAAEAAEKQALEQAEAERLARDRADQGRYYALIGQAARQLETGDVVGARLALDDVEKSRRHWEYYYLARQIEGTPLVLRGHANRVQAMAFSPDGSRLVTTSWDKTARVWDSRSGTELLTLRGHTAELHAVAWSSDGSKLATLSGDGTIKGWNARTGKEEVTITGPASWVVGVSWSPDAARLVSLWSDGSLRVYDIGSDKEPIVIHGPAAGDVVAWSPDRSRLATAADKVVKLWDARTGKELLTIRGHTAGVGAAAWSPDGSRLATASHDGTAKVWDARTGKEEITLRGHASGVVGISWSPDGARVATAAEDGTARVWGSHSANEELVLHGHAGGVCAVSWSPEGFRLATGSYDGTARVWDVCGGQPVLTFSGHSGAVAWSPDGSWLAAGSHDRPARVWDARTGKEALTFPASSDQSIALAYSPGGDRLATIGQGRSAAQVWNPHTGRKELTITGPEHADNQAQFELNSIAWSPDGLRLAGASNHDSVPVWDARTGAEVFTLRLPTTSAGVGKISGPPTTARPGARPGRVFSSGTSYGMVALAFSPDGTRLVASSAEGRAPVWDARTGSHLFTLSGYSGMLTAVSWSPDGTKLAAGCTDGTAIVWDTHSWAELLSCRGHTGQVNGVSWNPDGTRLATASQDDTARIWDARSGQEVLALHPRPGSVQAVAWSPDGTRLATSAGGMVNVWDARSGPESLVLRGHTKAVRAMAFAPDSTRLVSVDRSSRVLAWELPSGKPLQGSYPPPADSAPDAPGQEFDWHPVAAASPDVAWFAVSAFEVIRVYSRRPLPPPWGLDPWTEDEARRRAMAPVWHADGAAAAEKAGDWFAAAFHLERLIRYRPEDPSLRERRVGALDRLKRAEGAESRPGPATAAQKAVPGDPAGRNALEPSAGNGPVPPVNARAEPTVAGSVLTPPGNGGRGSGQPAAKESSLQDLPADPERFAAEWVLRRKGKLRVAVAGRPTFEVVDRAKLPEGPFSLEGIDFFAQAHVTDEDARVFRGLSRLRAVSLARTQVTDGAFGHLAGCRELQELDLRSTRVTDAGVKQLPAPAAFRILMFDGCNVSDDGLSGVRVLKHLQTLYLPRTRVSDVTLKRLEGLDELKDVDLGHTGITDRGLQSLTTCPNLYRLNINDTSVSDQGMEAVKRMSNLAILDLSGTRVTDKGLEHLRSLPRLADLKLAGTKLSDEGVRKLKAALPRCRIVWADANAREPVAAAAQGRAAASERQEAVRKVQPQAADGGEAQAAGRPVRVAPLTPGVSSRLLLARSARGKKSDILLCDLQGSSLRVLQNLTNQSGNTSWPAWSPDGKRIAFASDRDGPPSVYLMDADGRNVRRLTDAKEGSDQPTWSPDGTKIAFRRNWNVFVMNADGSGVSDLTGGTGSVNADPAWSPDGKQIAYASWRPGEGGYRVVVMGADGSDKRPISPADNPSGGVYPSWSPDGKRIVYSDRSDGALELFVSGPDGRGRRQLTRMASSNNLAGWTPDGKLVSFVHRGASPGESALYLIDPDNDRPVRIDGDPGADDRGRLSWRPIPVQTELTVNADVVSDLACARDLPRLKRLVCNGSGRGKGLVADLDPLRGLHLEDLELGHTQVADLSPLAGMPLVNLQCRFTPVSDLAPLRGMKLRWLDIGYTRVTVLAPLAGMPLEFLRMVDVPVSDLRPLAGMPLKVLYVNGTKVTDLTPLKGMKLVYFSCHGAPVKSLEPLRGMPLKHLDISFDPKRDAGVLRSIKTLERVNNKPVAEFWKEVEKAAAKAD